MGYLVRIRRRYFPKEIKNVKGFQKTFYALEVGRQNLLHENIHLYFVRNKSREWKININKLKSNTGLSLEEVNVAHKNKRYDSQLEKDISAGATQYGLKKSPAIFINKAKYEENLNAPSIKEQLYKSLLELGI